MSPCAYLKGVSHMILGVLPARFRELFNNRLSSTKGNCIACCFEKGKTSVTIWARNKVIPCTGLTCIKAATVRPATSYFVLSKSSTLKRGASLLLKYCHSFFFAAPFPLFRLLSFCPSSFILFDFFDSELITLGLKLYLIHEKVLSI